jgi:hypothetical protein
MAVSSILCTFTKTFVNIYFLIGPAFKTFYTAIFIALLCHNPKFSSFTSLALFYSALFLFFCHMSSKSYLHKAHVCRLPTAEQAQSAVTSYLHKAHVCRLPTAEQAQSAVTSSSCTTCNHTIVLMGKILCSAP